MAMPKPFPSLEEAQRLPVDVLALHVLWYLADIAPKYVHRADFQLDRIEQGAVREPGQPQVVSYGSANLVQGPARAYNEAWEWLAARGLITEAADRERHDYWTISRLGKRVATLDDPAAHLRSAALLDADLHPALGEIVRSLFAQGQYELAAFDAMRKVEIRVRELADAPTATSAFT